MQIKLIKFNEVDGVWSLLYEGLNAACQKCPDISLSFLWQQCRTGNAWLFVAYDKSSLVYHSAAVCVVDNWNGVDKLRVLAAYGGKSPKTWMESFQTPTNYLAALGCSSVVFDGRLGLQKRIPNVKMLRAVYEVEPNGR